MCPLIISLLDESDVGVMIDMNSDRIQNLRRESCRVSSTVELKKNLQHIVNQYIYNDSKYSINISSRTRQKILSSFTRVKNEVHNVPKFDWMDTSNIYKSYTAHASRTVTDSIDDEQSKLEMGSPNKQNGDKVYRMHAISDITDITDVQIEALKEAPKFDWIEKKGNNTIDVNKKRIDNELMIEYLITFDKAIMEILNLLSGDSLLRFYATNEYQRVLKKFMGLKNMERVQSD